MYVMYLYINTYIYHIYDVWVLHHHGFHVLFNISSQAFAGRKRGKNPWHVEDIWGWLVIFLESRVQIN